MDDKITEADIAQRIGTLMKYVSFFILQTSIVSSWIEVGLTSIFAGFAHVIYPNFSVKFESN